jgi:DNA-binding protein
MAISTDQSEQAIFIGRKPANAYVMVGTSQFATLAPGGTLTLKARGRAISRCVDVSEILTRKMLNGSAEVIDIQIDTENLEGRDGRRTNVSTMEITLAKTGEGSPDQKGKTATTKPELSKSELDKLTKDELVKLAQELEIPEKQIKKKAKKKANLVKLLLEATKKK